MKNKAILKQRDSQPIKSIDFDTSNQTNDEISTDEKLNSPIKEINPPRPHLVIQEKIEEVNREEKYERNSVRDNDRDDWTPKSFDYKNKIERLKQKSELEQEQLLQLEELQQKIIESEKYFYGQFKACLELEFLNSNEHRISSREISISFGRVEKEENIPLNLRIKNDSKPITIEIISVQYNILRAKLKDGTKIENINLYEVIEATINAQNPVFLLKE